MVFGFHATVVGVGFFSAFFFFLVSQLLSNLWPLQVELSWSSPFLQQAVLCPWQRQSISSQGRCLCALKPCFDAAKLFWDSFSQEPRPAGTVWQGPEPPCLSWPRFVLGWDEMLSGALSCLGQRGNCPAQSMCRGHQHQFSELHLAHFSYPCLINMCNHRFFSEINFYLDDEVSCNAWKAGMLPCEFTRLPFMK